MSRMNIAASALAAVTLSTAGCGGSSKAASSTIAHHQGPSMSVKSATQTTSAPGRPTNQTELVARANAICARLRAEGTATVVRSKQEYRPKLEAVATHYRTAATELNQLTPPNSMTSDWQQIVADHQQIAADMSKLIPYEEAGNFTIARRFLRGALALQRQIAAIAKRNGYTECGRPIE